MRIPSPAVATLVGLVLILSCGCRREDADTGQPAASADTATAMAKPLSPQASASPPTTPAALVLPGDFAADTTLEQLQQRFGSANAQARQIAGAEGESMRGVVLFPDDPSRRATLYFQDQENLRGLGMVSVDETSSQWKLASGAGIGTPLAELRKINGKPFTFSGFEWDYGGTITDWRGGKLQPANDDPVFVRIRLRMPESGSAGKDYPLGDSSFSSDDPRWADLGIVVGGISVSFPGEDDL
jgi:hypothetical protein